MFVDALVNKGGNTVIAVALLLLCLVVVERLVPRVKQHPDLRGDGGDVVGVQDTLDVVLDLLVGHGGHLGSEAFENVTKQSLKLN